MSARYDINEGARGGGARQAIWSGIERLESEIGSSGYLVGDSFSVADLTAAAMFTPMISPPRAALRSRRRSCPRR